MIINELIEEYNKLAVTTDLLHKDHMKKVEVVAIYKKEHVDLLHSYAIEKKSVELMKKVAEIISSSSVNHLQGLVSQGLQTIFKEPYTFHIEFASHGNNKTASFYVSKYGEDKVSLQDSGGGLQVVCSFILRVYCMIQQKIKPVLFMDEFFKHLSQSYTEGLMEFLDALVEQLGYKILWITHSQQFIDRVENKYEISKGVAKKL